MEATRQKGAALEEARLREWEAVKLAEVGHRIRQALKVTDHMREWDTKRQSKIEHLRQQVANGCLRKEKAKRQAAAAHARAEEVKRQAETAFLREKEAKRGKL